MTKSVPSAWLWGNDDPAVGVDRDSLAENREREIPHGLCGGARGPENPVERRRIYLLCETVFDLRDIDVGRAGDCVDDRLRECRSPIEIVRQAVLFCLGPLADLLGLAVSAVHVLVHLCYHYLARV